MTTLEKKIDALYRVVTAENDETRLAALNKAKIIFQSNIEPDVSKLIKQRVEETISMLGVRESLLGYSALTRAICLAVENPYYLQAITKIVYPTVAKEMNSTPSRVERSMRHAIDSVFDRCDISVINQFFGNSLSRHSGKCTNSDFIAKVAHLVRREIYED